MPILPRHPSAASRRTAPSLLLLGALVVVGISCFTDSTGPRRIFRGALAVQPVWVNPMSAGAPVDKAYIVVRRADGSIAKAVVITWPKGAIADTVSLDIPLGFGNVNDSVTVRFALTNAAGDTIFIGGPTKVLPIVNSGKGGGTPPGAPVNVPLAYAGPGRNAKTVTASTRDTSVVFNGSVTLTAVAKDSLGGALPGTLTAWTSLDTTRIVVTNKFGGTLGAKPVRGIAKVVVATLTGQADTVNVTVQPVPTAVVLSAGDGQSGVVGTALPVALRVRVSAADLGGVRNVPVVFAINSGGGSLSAATVSTDTGGYAQVTYTLGNAPGAATVRASVAGVGGPPVTFNATAIAATPTQLKFVVQPPANVAAASAIVPSLQVALQDALGNTVGSATNTVVLAIGTNPSGGLLGGTLSVAAVAGVATFPGITIDKAGVGYTLAAASSGLTGAISSAVTVTVGAAAQVVLQVAPPATATNGVDLATQPVVKVVDAGGNTVTGASGTITATIASGAGGSLITATAPIVAGVATFATLRLNGTIGAFTLQFSDGSRTVTSGTITLGVGAANAVVFQTPPPAVASNGVNLSTQPVVKVVDVGGNTVPGASGTITATVASGVGGSLVSSTATISAGIATFAALQLNGPIGNFTLQFGDGTRTITSGTITLSAGAPAAVVLQTPPPATATNGVDLATQPVVRVVDVGGNTVTGASGTITATIASGSGGSLVTNTAAIGSGVAAFSTLRLNGLIGNFTLQFSDGTRNVTSGTITLLAGAPAALVADSGNLQIGNPAASLGVPVVARVVDQSGNPVAGATINWTAPVGGGSVSVPSTITDANGRGRVGWTLGGVVGPNTVNAAVSGVATPASFGSFAIPVGTSKTWVSAVSDDWQLGANWNPAGVPGAADKVFVPTGTTFAPRLTAAASVTDLTVMATVPMNLQSFGVVLSGNLDGGSAVFASSGGFQMTGSAKTFVGLNLPNLDIAGSISPAAPSTTTGNVTVSSGTLSINLPTLVVGGTFATTGTGQLRMTTAGGDLRIVGNALFAGASTSGALTQGTLRVEGNLTQTSGTSISSFAPTSFHVTVLQGASPQAVTFASPANSGFRDLTVNNPAGVALATAGTLISGSVIATAGAIVGPSATIGIDFTDAGGATPNWQVTSLTLIGNSTRLLPSRVSSTTVTIVSGSTYTPTGKVRFTGAGGVTVTAGAFEVLAFADTIDGPFTTSGSGQLRMVTVGGDLLVLGAASFGGGNTSGILTQGTLRVAGNLTQASGGSALAFAPTTSHVTVLQGASAQTVTFANPGSSGFRDLTVNNPSGVALATAGTQITGSVIATAGAITGTSATIGIDFTDAGAPLTPNWQVTSLTLIGNSTRLLPSRVSSTNVTINTGSTYTPTGRVRFTGAGGVTVTNGAFEVLAFTDTIDGPFTTSGGGQLRMVTIGGDLLVLGAAAFGGGSTSGLLTQGTLRLAGSFSQTSGGAGGTLSFVSTTSHVTVFQGASAQTATFASPVNSVFRDLTVNNPAGLSLATAGTQITGSVIAAAGAITGPSATIGIDFTDAGAPLTPNWQVTSLTLTGQSSRLLPSRVISTNVTIANGSTYTPTARFRFTGAGGVTVTNGAIEVLAFTDTIDGPFTTSGGGRLRMVTIGGDLLVVGAAAFGGGSTSGLLTQGTLRLASSFSQTSGGAGGTLSFVSTTSHVTVFQGASAQTATFVSPVNSVFRDLTVNNPAGLSLATAGTQITGSVIATAGAITGPSATIGVDFTDAGAPLAPNWQVTSLTLTGNATRLIPPRVTSTNVTISNGGTYTPSGKVRFTGAGGVAVTAGAFEVLALSDTIDGPFTTSGGGQLRMATVGGDLAVFGNAAFGGGNTFGLLTQGTLRISGNFTQTSGGAGGTSSFVATTNHTTVMQGSTQGVSFAAPGTSVFNALTIALTSQTNFAGNARVNGPVTVLSTPIVTSGASDTVFLGSSLADASGRWQPTFTKLTGAGSPAIPAAMFNTVIVAATRTLAAPFIVTGTAVVDGTGVTLFINGQVLKAQGSPGAFVTRNNGVLDMTSVAGTDSLDVIAATFDGGSEVGRITKGGMQVRGAFAQLATTSQASFVASGAHTTWFTQTAASTLSIATGDSAKSRFNNVVFANSAAGPLTLTGLIFADGTLTANANASVSGTSGLLAARGTITTGSPSSLGTVPAPLKLLAVGGALAISGSTQSDTIAIFGLARAFAPSAPIPGSSTFLRIGTSGGITTFSGAGALTISDTLVISGIGAAFGSGPRTPVTMQGLKTVNGGVLSMASASDSVIVLGDALFDGGSEFGLLNSGSLVLRRNLTQLASTSNASFNGSGMHKTWLARSGGVQAQYSFATPGLTATTSHFHNVYLPSTTIDSLVSSAAADSLLTGPNLGAHGLAGSPGTVLTVGVLYDTTSTGVLRSGATGAGFSLRVTSKFLQAPATYVVDTTVYDVAYNGGLIAPIAAITSYKNVVVEGLQKWPGFTTGNIPGSVIVRNAGVFRMDSSTLTIQGDLVTTLGGRLTMPSTLGGSPVLTVNGNASFAGGSTAGLLARGTLVIAGNFTQGGGAIDAFQGGAGHATSFTAASRTISFANPDSNVAAPTGSRFGTLVVSACLGTTTLLTDVAVRDSIVSSLCTGATLTSSNKTLIVHGVNWASFQVQTTNVVWNRVSPAPSTLSSISFTGAYGATNAFTINNGSLGGGLTYGSTQLTFLSATRSTGAFVSANAVVSPFALNLTGVPPTGFIAGKFIQSGTATVTWP